MDKVTDLAERFGLIVVEDACQAHGAQYFSRKHNSWQTAGSIGRAAAFSFYPGKNLGACGEAGAVTTNDASIDAQIRMIRDHGQARKYYHDVEGYNGRLDAIQAGLLHVKLKHLTRWNEQRRERAAEYNRLFHAASNPVQLINEPEWSRGVYHLYVVRSQERDGLLSSLKEQNIGTGIHYPIPLHLQKAYRHLNYQNGDFPICEKAAKEIISLPMFPHLKVEEQQRVVRSVAEFVENRITVEIR